MIRLLRSIYCGCLSKRAVLGRLRQNITSGQRRALLEHFGAQIGPSTRLAHPINLINADKDFSRLSIGENVFIGHNVLFDLKDHIQIGNNVTLSMNVVLATHLDVGQIPLAKLYPADKGPIHILDDVYVGSGAIILHGLTVGPHAVIAAGAVVVEDVPPGTAVGGVPARILKRLDEV